MKQRQIDIVEIPSMDTTFMKDIMDNGIADSAIDLRDDNFFSYDNKKMLDETSEERLRRFGFDVEKIKEW